MVTLFAPGNRVRQRAFTTVELMLVVLLIGVLTAIALPSYSRYRDRVMTAHAVATIVSVAALIDRYVQDERQYPPDLAALRIPTPIDPWGHPYVYYNVDANGRGHARKDHALNPINTDFDLYSMGPDGQTKKQITQKDSLDDIIRASNGRFVGVAADF